MSQSPSEADGSIERYLEGSLALTDLLHQGKSFSGRERHCAFLNTGDGRFANVSGISGLDLPEDGRALATVDQDLDGDLDVWILHRTAPILRLWRNDAAGQGRTVAVSLRGTASNRDAVGARVELMAGDGLRRVRTTRAGEGFLTQSTRWLHFGVGSAPGPFRAEVRWPNGTRETFPGLEAGKMFVLVEGEGRATPWSPPAGPATLAPLPAVVPEATERARIVDGARVPVPALPYDDLDGTRRRVGEGGSGPLLLNLWASWCTPCVRELGAFQEAAGAFAEDGLRVLAVSVDGLGDVHDTGPDDARAMLRGLGWSHGAGFATPELLDKVERLVGTVFGRRRPLPVPSSLLIDPRGVLAVVYRGPVEVATVRADLAALSRDPAALYADAFPFRGIWAAPPPPTSVAALGLGFLDAGYPNDAAGYLDYARALIAANPAAPPDPLYADGRLALGRAVEERGDDVQAAAQFREGLRVFPDDLRLRSALGRALGRQGEFDEGLAELRAVAQARPDAPAYNDIGSLLAQADRVEEAEAAFRTALERDPDHHLSRRNLARLLGSSGRGGEALALLREGVERDPDAVEPRLALAGALDAGGLRAEALAQYLEALRLRPRLPLVSLRVAWWLATDPDPALRDGNRAVALARPVCEATGNGDAAALDVLAAALAEAGAFDEAATTARRAAELAAAEGDDERAGAIRVRAEAYARGEAHREARPGQ